MKALLYYTVHGVREIGVCSDFDPMWDAHPEWQLRNATGPFSYKPASSSVPASTLNATG